MSPLRKSTPTFGALRSATKKASTFLLTWTRAITAWKQSTARELRRQPKALSIRECQTASIDRVQIGRGPRVLREPGRSIGKSPWRGLDALAAHGKELSRSDRSQKEFGMAMVMVGWLRV